MKLNRQRSTRGSLVLVFFIMLMDVIGIMVLSPVAPYLVQRYSKQALMVTMITVVYAGGQFIAAPLMGKIGDRIGRRPVLLVSLVGQGIGYLIFAFGGALWVLFLGRLIGGITGGNFSTAAAYIADVSKPEERTRNFTMIGVPWSLGLILGPALGGIVAELSQSAGGIFAQFSLVAPAYVSAALSFLNVFLGLFVLPESLPKEKRETKPLRFRDYNPAASIFEMARKPGLGSILLAFTLFNFAFNGINSIAAVFVIQKFFATPFQVSLLLVFGGIALTLVTFLLVQKLVSRLGEKVAAVISLVGQAAGNLAIFFAPVFWLIFPFYMFNSAMSCFTFPTMTTLCTDLVMASEVGLLMGVTTALGSLMNIFGPLSAGLAYDHIMGGAPYWIGPIFFILAILPLLRSNIKNKVVPAG